jgi:hypothetical protein
MWPLYGVHYIYLCVENTELSVQITWKEVLSGRVSASNQKRKPSRKDDNHQILIHSQPRLLALLASCKIVFLKLGFPHFHE